MEAQRSEVYSFTPISAGVDWLTATAKAGVDGRRFREVGNALITQERASGGDVKPDALRDYVGHRSRGMFVGHREQDSIIVLSGRHAPNHFDTVARAATNVSRLDLQVSLWTHGETPDIASEEYDYLRSLPPSRGRPRNLTLITSHPKGQTLNVGKRQSDAYGRVYDWSSAHKTGEAKTVWRYEVEFKRKYALNHCRALLDSDNHSTRAERVVHAWFADRHLRPSWTPDDAHPLDELPIEGKERDVLGWFEVSVSRTIARAISRYGVERVVAALGLSEHVEVREGRNTRYATLASRTVQDNLERRDSRATDAECFPLPDAEL